MKKIVTLITGLCTKAHAQQLTTFAALSAISLEVLHIPLTPIIWSALGGALYFGISPPPTAPLTRAQTLIQVCVTIIGVPVGALFALALTGSAGLASDSLWVSVAAVVYGFGLHRLLPLISDKLGGKLERVIDVIFGKAGA